MQTTSYSLGELLRQAKNGSLKIPQFQRQFIWNETQVKRLIDSMSRSYPMGSLLLLARKEDLPLATRNIEAEIRDECPLNGSIHDSAEKDDELYILDGQQRTTSIARVFLNSHPSKIYYFDLKRMLDEYHHEDISWIRDRKRGKTEPDRKDNNKLLRTDIILKQEKADIYVSEYIEDSGDFPEYDRTESRKAAARIKGVFETMRNYKVPVVILDRDNGIEAVCRVFETINSTGTRLTTFDLAVARFYPQPDLRRLWEHAKEEHPILKSFNVDGERVLQVLYLMMFARNDKYPDPTRKNLLGLDRDRVEREWNRAAMVLAETYSWARAYGARPETLPSGHMLVALAALKVDDASGDNPWEEDEAIRRWYFSNIMQAGASQASNYRIGGYFRDLRAYVMYDKTPNAAEVILNAAMVLQLRPSDVRYKSLQNVFSMTLRYDLISGRKIDSNSVLHDHHIYPRAARQKHGLNQNRLDSICNRVPILAPSNMSLGEGYPERYFGEMAERARSLGTLGDLSRRLRDAMIPGNPEESTWANIFSIERFDEFCRKRAELIVARVREIVGDALRVDIRDDDEVE